MKKPIKVKVIAVTSVAMLILVGTSLYVIDRNRVIMDPIRIVETENIDTVIEDESSLTGSDIKEEVMDAVKIENSANEINTEVAEVIEEDEQTGSITIENTEGDVVVTNDEALAIAEANSEADDILKSIMADYVAEDNNTVEKADKAEIKVDKPEVKKSDEELKKVYSSEATPTKKNDDVEIDEATKDLFAEMGWDLTIDHSKGNVIPEGVSLDEIEGRVVEGKTKGNPFRTP